MDLGCQSPLTVDGGTVAPPYVGHTLGMRAFGGS